MQPNQTNPDYSFIQNAGAKKAGPGKKQRIMIVVGLGVVLLIVGIIVSSFLFGGSNDSATRTLKLAQTHTELIRISELGMDKARGQAAKNLATTTNLTLLSEQSAIVSIAEKDQEITKKILSFGQNSDTDDTLTEAEQRSQFDEVFIELLVKEMEAYRQELEAAYDASNSNANKQTYQKLYDSLNKIIETTK